MPNHQIIGGKPYRQYHSPYVGMGNDPINGIDPDGGYKTKFGRFLA